MVEAGPKSFVVLLHAVARVLALQEALDALDLALNSQVVKRVWSSPPVHALVALLCLQLS